MSRGRVEEPRGVAVAEVDGRSVGSRWLSPRPQLCEWAACKECHTHIASPEND